MAVHVADPWLREYLLLALRLGEKVPGFVDYYYGPAGLREAVKAEGSSAPEELLRIAGSLAERLGAQGYGARREAFLSRQVLAMETLCRQLAGEVLSLAEETRRFYDMEIAWTPESEFEQAHAIYEELLPGEGSIYERMDRRRERFELSPERSGLLQSFLEKAVAELRRRTRTRFGLPEGEEITVTTVTNKGWGAANWYKGNLRSLVEVNTDLPFHLSSLISLMAHEAYPGHHTEAVMKEQHLVQEQGYAENCLLLTNSPQVLIAEGIAMLAPDMIFEPDEVDGWLAEHIYPEAGMEFDGVDRRRLARAGQLLEGLQGNASIMLNAEGRPDDEVVQYLMRYGCMKEERSRKAVGLLRDPLFRGYVFTYSYGERLMKPLLDRSADPAAMFRRLLTEQTYPALLVEWTKE